MRSPRWWSQWLDEAMTSLLEQKATPTHMDLAASMSGLGTHRGGAGAEFHEHLKQANELCKPGSMYAAWYAVKQARNVFNHAITLGEIPDA